MFMICTELFFIESHGNIFFVQYFLKFRFTLETEMWQAAILGQADNLVSWDIRRNKNYPFWTKRPKISRLDFSSATDHIWSNIANQKRKKKKRNLTFILYADTYEYIENATLKENIFFRFLPKCKYYLSVSQYHL